MWKMINHFMKAKYRIFSRKCLSLSSSWIDTKIHSKLQKWKISPNSSHILKIALNYSKNKKRKIWMKKLKKCKNCKKRHWKGTFLSKSNLWKHVWSKWKKSTIFWPYKKRNFAEKMIKMRCLLHWRKAI